MATLRSTELGRDGANQDDGGTTSVRPVTPVAPASDIPVPRAARPGLPGASASSLRRTIRYLMARSVSIALARSMLRISVDGRQNLPDGPYLICFGHGSWADPFVLMAVLPWRPRLYFFGPKEEDMSRGGRNRLMRWAGNAVPYRP